MTSVLTSPPKRLSLSDRIQERLHQGELTPQQVDDFQDFLNQVDREFLQHRIITHNAYTRWFREGRATDEELQHFIQQFSVFPINF